MAIDDNTSYELTGYQVKDLAQKIRAKADATSLATVATSGLYSDLLGTPTIPTVYNGTLTITQGGTTLGTFSANQSANTTINIPASGGMNHLFYVSDSLNLNQANSDFYIYKDSALTTAATYREIFDAAQDGGLTVLQANSSGFYMPFLESSGGAYTNYPESDDNYNYIRLENGREQMTIEPSSYDDPDYPDIAGTFNNSEPIYLAKEEYKVILRRKANVQGVYMFTNTSLSHNFTLGELIQGVKGSAAYTLLSGTIDIYTLDQTSTTRNHPYRGGFFLNANFYSYAGVSPETDKFLYAVLVKRVGGDFINLLCRIEEPTPGSGELTITEIPFDQVMTGATSSVAGTAGLVPAPTTSDPDKFLKGDGTWATVPAGETTTVFYWDGLAMYKDSGFSTAATMSDVGTAASAGPVKIYFANRGIYEYLVTDKITADNYFSTVWSDGYGNLRSVAYTYPSNTWDRTSVSVQKQLTASTGISIDSSGNISASGMTGATSQDAGTSGAVPAPAAGDQEKVLHGDGTWKDTTAKLVEMSYGEANAWTKFINAYNAGSIVYCRASSNANPATGSQTRKAFMAYVNNAASPTNVEFQYVRSVGTKTSSQPVDQVFVYKLESTNGGTWSVTTRDMAPKIAAGTGINVSYSNGTYTISLA